ncbi:MAG: hypothetical protein SFZ03_05775 [Candidatus Melainabacteria bacterium]|nr:hypothetical protein [Candidatus Melainabacteria bacterium]
MFSFFIRVGFSLAYLGLLLSFVIQLFQPPNLAMQSLFDSVKPLIPWLNTLDSVLGAPVHGLAALARLLLPAGWLGWFPSTPAGETLRFWLNGFMTLPGASDAAWLRQWASLDYRQTFTGVIRWDVLLTVFLLGGVESLWWSLVESVRRALIRLKIRYQRTAPQGYTAPHPPTHP